jgi:hypothetical protein
MRGWVLATSEAQPPDQHEERGSQHGAHGCARPPAA